MSSAKIRSADFNTSIDLKVISPRFPIGVGTTNSLLIKKSLN